MTLTASNGAVAAAQPAAALRNSEFLSFTLGQEEYGIEILKVQEIRCSEAVTHIANAPAFIKGVVNLRGIKYPQFYRVYAAAFGDGVSCPGAMVGAIRRTQANRNTIVFNSTFNLRNRHETDNTRSDGHPDDRHIHHSPRL